MASVITEAWTAKIFISEYTLVQAVNVNLGVESYYEEALSSIQSLP